MAAADSTVWTWGRAKNYRLGRAFVGTDARVPEKVRGFEGVAVRQAACGGGHTAVVLEDDRLFTFGYSQYGQLGLGDRTDMCDPQQVYLVPPSIDTFDIPGSTDTTYTADTISIIPDLTGITAALVTGDPLPVAEVCCGRYHTIARTVSGLVFTWGGGKNGRLGHGDEKIRAQPACVESLLRFKAVRVTAGYHNNLVLTENGNVWSWGWGAHGQLGLGDKQDREIPTVIPSLSGENVVELSCGDRHSFAVTGSGKVFGWGSNEFGQLGCGRKGDTLLVPQVISGLDGLVVKHISSGDRHSAAVTNTGSVYTWGCGTDGQCGHGTFSDTARPKLVEFLVGKTVVDVKCGHNFTMVLTKNEHHVYAWGNNTYGQLGNNGNGKSNIPVQVIVNSGAKVSKVACAHFHCILWMTVVAIEAKKKIRIKIQSSTTANKKKMKKDDGDANNNEAEDTENGKARLILADANEKLAPLLEKYQQKKNICRDALDKEKTLRENALKQIAVPVPVPATTV